MAFDKDSSIHLPNAHCFQVNHLADGSAVGRQVAIQGGPSLASQDDEIAIAAIQALARQVDVQGASMSSNDR